MATTGFWPIRKGLAGALRYVENPDKTTDLGELDKSLYAAVKYAGNLEKTDRCMYVAGINCSKYDACSQMMAVKRKFGERGKNIAYHGYQSFAKGEVTPAEAFAIGKETARRMWGDRFQVVVTTHLNTDNIHNHFVVNSVSFKDGSKFRDKIGDHMELRRISDEICQAHYLSVLKDSDFYSRGKKKAYWLNRDGKPTHRDILKKDLDEAMSKTTTYREFWDYLKGLGYSFPRDCSYEHPSIIAPGWKRPVRIDSLGEQYSMESIRERLVENQYDPKLFVVRPLKMERSPLLELENKLDYEITHSKDTVTVLVDVLFFMLLMLLKLARDRSAQGAAARPHSPLLRQAVNYEEQLTKEYFCLRNNGIHTEKELAAFIDRRRDEISELEKERQAIRNSNRRPKTQEEREAKNAAARELSKRLKPLRAELKTAKSAFERYPMVWELLRTERDMETAALEKQHHKHKERKYER